jgi:Tol biopolymer transport system component
VAVQDRVSLADLLSTTMALTVADAVALIVQLARSPLTGRPIRTRLDVSHVWLHDDGTVTLSPGLLPPLAEVAALLDTLLGRVETASGMPRGLVSLVEQVKGHKAGFTIPSLSAFAAALEPFQPPDPASAVRTVVTRLDDFPIEEAGPASEVIPEPSPPPIPRPLPSPLPDPLPEPLPEPMPDPLPALLPAPRVPDVAATPGVTARSWRPSAWQVLIAIAATLIAALIGGAFGRWRYGGAMGEVGLPAAADSSMREAPSPSPRTTAKPEPGPEIPPPSPVAGTATVTPIESSPAHPVAPRPARLVDRHTVHADAVFSPSFAADGSAVLFHAEEGGESALKRAEPDDHGELHVATIVDDGARNYHVRLSPDGSKVAFDSDRDGERGVYVADADGHGVRKVSGDGYAAVPTWAPDGRRLAFLRAEPQHPSVWNLWLLDRDSGRQTRITSFPNGQVWGGAWFGDGKRIVYSHEDRLTIHDLASGQGREFASPLKGRLVRTPAVSPDGRWIMFQVYRDGAWLLDVERGVMQRVLQDPSAEEFAWSPDGRRVAYHSQRSGGWNLWTMAVP